MRCWEFNKCGHEPGGVRAGEGVCPGSQAANATCWSVINTLCHGAVQSQFREKLAYCLKCPYFVRVIGEQTGGEQLLKQIFAEKADESAGTGKT